MVTDELILAIDQGTGSSKALLVDHQGTIVGRGLCSLVQSTPRPGWVEQSVDHIWDSVCEAVSFALAGRDPAKIAAVGLSTQRESVVAVGPGIRQTGQPADFLAGSTDRADLPGPTGGGTRRNRQAEQRFAAGSDVLGDQGQLAARRT